MLCRIAILSLCGLVAGCGTHLRGLLAEEAAEAWDVQVLTAEAEGLGLGLERPVHEADAEKQRACAFLNEAVTERMEQGEPSVGEAFINDLGEIMVLVIPIESVERCAGAQRRYLDAVADLRRRLGALARTGSPSELSASPAGQPRAN